MVPVFEDRPVSPSLDGVDEEDRVVAIDRLHELVRGGSLSLERFSAILEQVLAAVGHADLEAAMLALPPLWSGSLRPRAGWPSRSCCEQTAT